MLERRRYTDNNKFQGFFMGLYKRNELLLIISAAIFFGSLFAGYFLAGFVDQIMAGALKSFKDSISKGQIKLTTLSIFINNMKIAFFLYGGGIFVGITTLIMLAYNGLFIGYVASKFNIGDFLIYTIPHGVFELSGIVVAGAAGLRLASTVINILRDIFDIQRHMPVGEQLKSILDANYFEFKDSLKLFLIAAVLLLIGAIIEANFTVAWGNFIKGII
ncbi:MAG: stage II sporulation protein M [Methanobacterium sp.]